MLKFFLFMLKFFLFILKFFLLYAEVLPQCLRIISASYLIPLLIPAPVSAYTEVPPAALASGFVCLLILPEVSASGFACPLTPPGVSASGFACPLIPSVIPVSDSVYGLCLYSLNLVFYKSLHLLQGILQLFILYIRFFNLSINLHFFLSVSLILSLIHLSSPPLLSPLLSICICHINFSNLYCSTSLSFEWTASIFAFYSTSFNASFIPGCFFLEYILQSSHFLMFD